MGIKTKLNPLGGKGIVPYESSFQFTVRQASTSTPTTIYFSQQYDTIDYDVLIDWGDGAQTIIPAGVNWTSSIYRPTHDYGNTTEEYTISISSSKNIIPVLTQDYRINDVYIDGSKYLGVVNCITYKSAYVTHILTPLLKFDWYNISLNSLYKYRLAYLFAVIAPHTESSNSLQTICDDLLINNPELECLNNMFARQGELQYDYMKLIRHLYAMYKGKTISLYRAFHKLPSTATMTQENFEEYTSKYYGITDSLDYAYYGFLFSSFPFNFVDYPNVTDFSSTFSSCSNLTTIPEGLFQYNTAVTSFSDTFGGCEGLTTIPEGLFQYNIAANFGHTFWWGENLVLNSNIFCNEATDMHTRFLDVLFSSTTNTGAFYETFESFSYNSITGTAPRLWKYTYLRTPSSKGCFSNCTGLSNWNYIPTNWGGPYSWVVIKSYPEATVEFITDSETEIENPDEPYGIGVVEDSSVTYTVSKTGFNTITNTVTATGYDVYEVNLEPTNKTLIQQYTYLLTVPETLVDGNNFIINEDLLAITSGPSSYHIDNSASYGYLQITVPENSFYYVEINAYVSSWPYIHNSSLSDLQGSIGGAVITSQPYQPNMKEAMFKLPREGFIFNEYGNNTSKLYTRTLSTGTHYLNFFYVKQNSFDRNEDRLIIDSINIYQADL